MDYRRMANPPVYQLFLLQHEDDLAEEEKNSMEWLRAHEEVHSPVKELMMLDSEVETLDLDTETETEEFLSDISKGEEPPSTAGTPPAVTPPQAMTPAREEDWDTEDDSPLSEFSKGEDRTNKPDVEVLLPRVLLTRLSDEDFPRAKMPRRGRSVTPSPELAVLCEELEECEVESPTSEKKVPLPSSPGIKMPLAMRQRPSKSTAISMMEYCNKEEIEMKDYTLDSTELCQRVTFRMDNLPDWSEHMTYIDGDFLNCQKPLVVFATVDLKFKTPLLITMEREMGAQEFLFNQRRGVGEVAIMPRITTMTKEYVFYLMGKMNNHEKMTYPAMRESIRKLLSELRRLRIQEIALPSRDSVRDDIPWFQIYDAFDVEFKNAGRRVLIMEYHYLTYPKLLK